MRERTARFIVAGILLIAVVAAAPVFAEQFTCELCGMTVDGHAPFSAMIDTGKQARRIHFCDIGDLLAYVREKRTGAANALVRDYRSGEWIHASKAFYVHAPHRFTTPMGWSIAAFKDRAVAQEYGVPLDLATVSRRVAP